MSSAGAATGPAASGWRVKTAFAIFVASLGWPLVLPVLPFLGVSGATIAATSGVLVVVAEILLLAAAAIAGKEGFAYIKSRVFGLLRSHGPPQTVSRARYRLGLVMFSIPLLVAWATPYFGRHLPGFEDNALAYAAVFDVLFVTSLFVLGGDFWDKLRSLFVYDATARMAARPTAPGPIE